MAYPAYHAAAGPTGWYQALKDYIDTGDAGVSNFLVEHNSDGTHDFPGTPTGAKFLRDDRTWAVPPTSAPAVINVQEYGAVGDASTDDTAAIQAALDACDVNLGGDVLFPLTAAGGYRIASGLSTAKQGTRLIGQGHPGGGDGSGGVANGSVKVIVADGVTGLTLNPGGAPSHQTRGYAIDNLCFKSESGATTGNGVLCQEAERLIIRDVTALGFVAGYGLRITAFGAGGNAQYAELLNYSAGNCLYGLHTTGSSPNGVTMFGGYFAGNTTPAAGSKAIWLEKGDTHRLFGVKVQGYETGIDASPSSALDPFDLELFGYRSEYNNVGLKFGANIRKSLVVGGMFDNFLLGGGGSNIGIQIISGAEDVVISPYPTFSSITTAISNSGTRTRYGVIAAAKASASSVATVNGVIQVYDHAGASLGYVPIYTSFS